jgi:23S rRNA pseudouridine1911/1915/1917 synthase
MNHKLNRLKVEAEDAGKRLDRFLADKMPEHSRSMLQRLLKDGAVTRNGNACTAAKVAVAADEIYEIAIPEPVLSELPLAENIPLPVLFEDDWMLVINKPPGMVVHPGAGNTSGTVVNALLGHCPELAEFEDMASERPGIVHRLDKDTSGCLVIAKTPQAMAKLSAAFAERRVRKVYKALVKGIPRQLTETIETNIGRSAGNRQKMAVLLERGGKEAITTYTLAQSGKIGKIAVSLLDVKILTGRTHQIRVHLSYRKLPIIGDTVYGGNQAVAAPRQMLHAWKITLPHPRNGRKFTFTAPIPEDMDELLARMTDVVVPPPPPSKKRRNEYADEDGLNYGIDGEAEAGAGDVGGEVDYSFLE